MTELILFLIIFFLLGVIVWLIHQYHAQEKKLIKALLSKDVHEFTMSELAERPTKKEKEVESDLIPMSDVSDEEFHKALQKMAGGNG